MGEELPPGCIMLCTDDKGRHIATVTDFDRQGYGGFTLKDAQRIRCKHQIARAVIDRYSSPVIGDNMTQWHQDELMNKLKEKGWQVHEVYVGHGGDDA